jgi:DNA-binding transcriptional LysR family regulator
MARWTLLLYLARTVFNVCMAQLEYFRLSVFRAVAEHLSFRKAAEELYLTQPAVSLQIKALEEELGAQLFDRVGRKPRLTPSGALLLDYAHRSSEQLEQAQNEIAALGGSYAGQLTLGASTTIAQYVLPAVVGNFCKTHPRVRPTLISGNTEHIVEAVEKGTIALGFIEGPPRSNVVRTEPFLRDELVLIAPAAHAWARKGTIAPAALTEGPLLLRERGSGTRRIVELALERAGIRTSVLNIVMQLDSTEAIKSAVESGFGSAFVSRCAIATDLRLDHSVRIVTIEGLQLHREFLVVLPRGPELRGLAQEFHRFLLEHIGRHTRRARP